MGARAISVHHGPSIYSRHPVIRYRLELAGDLNPFAERLFALSPEVREHYAGCPSAVEHGSHNGNSQLAHLFEHACIVLQSFAGARLTCVRAGGARIGQDEAVIPFDDERVVREAVNLAIEASAPPTSAESRPNWKRRLRGFVRFAKRDRLPVQDMAIVRAAAARDIPIIQIGGRLLQLGHGRHQQRVNGTKTTHTNTFSNDLAANKDYARRVLRAFGLPVPKYERVDRKEDAVAAAQRIGFPVVVKPNRSKMGRGVSVGVKTPDEVREAFERTGKRSRSVLVEEFVEGADYRTLVIDGKLVAAAKRVPAHVIGDGRRTIEQLVRRANRDPRRGDRQANSWTRLELDDQADRLLAERNHRRDSVPFEGEIVYLRRVANTSAGGTAIDVTDHIHPENREIAEGAARAVGLDIAGVDLLVRDITQPMSDQGGVICEINSRPGLRKHLWPAEGRPRDVIGPIVEMLFPPGSRSRIPIAVVTGNGDTRSVARKLADLMGADGFTVGLAAHDGVFIQGKRADLGAVNLPAATRMLLLDSRVDLAIVDAPDGIARVDRRAEVHRRHGASPCGHVGRGRRELRFEALPRGARLADPGRRAQPQ
jgi:cyanophycin synthetase